MADLMVHKNFLIDKEDGYDKERFEANKKWMEAMLQEKKMIAGKLKLEIENLKVGKIAEMQGNLIMIEAEVKHLQEKLDKLKEA